MNFTDPAIQAYCEQFTSPESPALAALNRETHLKVLYPQMLAGQLQGRLLSTFSQMMRPQRIVEVGTYTGYSAICMAEGLAEGGTLTTIEINPEREEMIRRHVAEAGFTDQIDLRIGNALDVLPTLEGPVDMAFLDADKHNYVNYYEAIFPKLRVGGLILADNILWSGRVLDKKITDKETQGLRSFVQHVAADPRVQHVLMPVRDGIMMITKISN